NVGMALISGRPISFQMDLYQPLYVPRPMVEPELFASLRPPTYDANMDRAGAALNVQAGMQSHKSAGRPGMSGGGSMQGGPGGPPTLGMDAYGMAGEMRRSMGEGKPGNARADESRKRLQDALVLQEGVQSAATAAKLGDFFQYVLDNAVTLARQKS